MNIEVEWNPTLDEIKDVIDALPRGLEEILALYTLDHVLNELSYSTADHELCAALVTRCPDEMREALGDDR